ncbi:MAG: hypothetical protein QMD85_00795 [Candidatus Aenigmarchaeota archaeon]|nr:hypothetical protein [Candidatus Aenigmarchaeota archaeon]
MARNIKVMVGALALMIIMAVVMSMFFDAGQKGDAALEGTPQQPNNPSANAGEQSSGQISDQQNLQPQNEEAVQQNSQQTNEQPNEANQEIIHDAGGNEIAIPTEQVRIFNEATTNADAPKCGQIANEGYRAMCVFLITDEKDCDALNSVAEFRDVCR